MKQMKLIKNKYLQYCFVGLLFIVFPFIPGVPTSLVTIAGTIVYLSIAGIGFNVLLGFSGQISLGHAAFMGSAAYISAFCTQNLGWSFFPSVLVACIVPGIMGAILGIVAVRLQGMYLAIATLGFGEILRTVFIEADFITGSYSGKRAAYPVIFGHEFNKIETYILLSIVLVISLIVVYNFINSKVGRALAAIRSDETLAKAMGVSIVKYKLMAFVISTVFAGIAGVAYVHFVRYSDPTVWTMALSLDLVALCVIGGLGTIGGPVVGALVLRGLPELLKSIPGVRDLPGLPLLFYGCLVVVIVMFYDKGLIRIPGDIYNKIRNHKNKNNQDSMPHQQNSEVKK